MVFIVCASLWLTWISLQNVLNASFMNKAAKDLAEGRFEVENRPVLLSDIRALIYVIGNATDHVAPWPSAFKIRSLTYTDVTFALTSGGSHDFDLSEPSIKSVKQMPHMYIYIWR